ncbi:hypothetical protein LCGC14_0359820 [marine sediment metagenome]|uniref:Uncharacterized protein n=1 Tax=marine sediment metagenome TaxID=412755 RepID=A0A0F9WGE7_9ZZZZ
MNVKKEEITSKHIKLQLRGLIDKSDGKINIPSTASIEELFEILEVFIIYTQFDLEATRRELRNAIGK